MGEESDHVHITALTSALGVGVRVIYLDGRASSATSHDFGTQREEGGEGGEEGSSTAASPLLRRGGEGEGANAPPVVLLYRPGHYDILYLR